MNNFKYNINIHCMYRHVKIKFARVTVAVVIVYVLCDDRYGD